jgi:hypothetical protein
VDIRAQLQSLLGSGVSPSAAAAAVGCDPSYVSQLLADEQFAMEVSKLRVNRLEEATQRDRKWDSLEDKLLAKLEDLLPFMVRPMEVVKALSMVNAAKRRGATASDQQAAQVNNVVVLQLPATIKQHYVVNDRHEVVEVAGRPLVTIDGQKLLQNLKGGNHAQPSNRQLANAEI